MPLPTHLHQLLSSKRGELVRLETDDLFQLVAYLNHRDKFCLDGSRAMWEDDHGITTHRQESHDHTAFRNYLRQVRDYNILIQESSIASLPSMPIPKKQAVKSWSDLGVGIAENEPLVFIPPPTIGDKVKKTSGKPLFLRGKRWQALFGLACSAANGRTISKRELERHLIEATGRKRTSSTRHESTLVDGLKVRDRARKRFTDTLADLRRELRQLVDGPETGALVDLGQEIDLGFVVQGLIEDEERHFTFGLARGK